VPNPTPGRHRAPGAPSPVSALSSALSRSTRPIGKASAVLAVSGGLVASFSLPASASPLTPQAKPAAAPAAAPALEAVAVSTAVPSRAAVVAPRFGEIGFEGVVKPKPKPKPKPAPVVEVEQAVSAERASAADQPSRTSRRTSPVAADSGNDSGAKQERPASSGILGIAASLTGIPYVYGGTTPAGFDCSGYTQWVFGKAGRSLPRTAEAQRQAATPVSDPQPGDLVFFGAPAFHVGIYAGGGMMYDSPRTGKPTAKRSIWSSSVTYGRF
jgi:cell wall-associated NlpC family hydrolase